MDQRDATINGPLLRLRRETRGWGQSDVATRACMSIKQIRQLEDGGLSAFYSEAIKITAAKKVGTLLGMTDDEVFSLGQTAPEAQHEPTPVEYAPAEEQLTHVAEPEASVMADEPVGLRRASVQDTPAQPEPVEASATQVNASSSEGKSKTSWGLLMALFVGALVLAAYFRPVSEPAATEPPPPLQPALQAEPADPAASAASAAQEGNAAATANPAAPAANSTPAATTPATAAPAPEAAKPAAPVAPAIPAPPAAPNAAPAALAPKPAAAPAATAPAASSPAPAVKTN